MVEAFLGPEKEAPAALERVVVAASMISRRRGVAKKSAQAMRADHD